MTVYTIIKKFMSAHDIDEKGVKLFRLENRCVQSRFSETHRIANEGKIGITGFTTKTHQVQQ